MGEVFKRADIQHIRSFLLDGVETNQINHAPYEQRLEKGMDEAMSMVRLSFLDEYERLDDTIMRAVSAYRNVYMEVGVTIGMKLAIQIFALNL